MSLANQKLFFCDLETTGLWANVHGVHQIAFQIWTDGVFREDGNFHVRPFDFDEITPKALKIGKVTHEQIQTYPDSQVVFPKLIAILSKYINRYDRADKFFFVGYNACFDSRFLSEWFRKCRDPYYASWFQFPVIDVAQLAAIALLDKKPEMRSFSLSSVAKHLEIKPNGQLHDAQTDIDLTARIFFALNRPLV